MDSAASFLSPASVDENENTWRAQKRFPERDSYNFDHDDVLASAKDIECNDIKRFRSTTAVEARGLVAEESCLESPMIASTIRHRNDLRSNANIESTILSPITEISQNMSEASLSASNGDNNDEDGDDELAVGGKDVHADGTPLKSWSKSSRITTHKCNHLTRMLQMKSGNDTLPAKETTITSDLSFEGKLQQQADNLDDEASNNSDSGFPRNSEARRLNMDFSSTHGDMIIDELSFYDDEEPQQQRSLSASPQLLGLLSPEGSPQRFQIVERRTAASATAAQARLLQPAAANRHKATLQSTFSSNPTPAKSFRVFGSLSSAGSTESTSMDDEYMEFFEMESLDSQSPSRLNLPSDLSSLISGNIKHASSPAYNNNHNRSSNSHNNSHNNSSSSGNSSLVKTPEMRRPPVRRCLSMTDNYQHTPKTPERLLLKQAHETTANATTPFASSTNCCFKRPEPPSSANNSPILCKRYRSGADKENMLADAHFVNVQQLKSSASPAANVPKIAPARQNLRKSMSMNDAEILSALTRSESADQPDLIGDFSKPFILPLMEGRHCDLKSISSNTVARLINGEFDDQVASYKIIDCRYPYEFEGGHIRGAKNLYTQEQIIEEFLSIKKTEQQQASDSDAGDHKRNIIIFHCEFSSERGPKLSRFLRNNDRARNTNLYPALDYPEIYLLHNGYKEFYETHSELCEPVAYRPMLEPSFSEAYRHFRAKSKSWNGDGLGGATSRMKKSRSRLLL